MKNKTLASDQPNGVPDPLTAHTVQKQKQGRDTVSMSNSQAQRKRCRSKYVIKRAHVVKCRWHVSSNYI